MTNDGVSGFNMESGLIVGGVRLSDSALFVPGVSSLAAHAILLVIVPGTSGATLHDRTLALGVTTPAESV